MSRRSKRCILKQPIEWTLGSKWTNIEEERNLFECHVRVLCHRTKGFCVDLGYDSRPHHRKGISLRRDEIERKYRQKGSWIDSLIDRENTRIQLLANHHLNITISAHITPDSIGVSCVENITKQVKEIFPNHAGWLHVARPCALRAESPSWN